MKDQWVWAILIWIIFSWEWACVFIIFNLLTDNE